MNQLAYTAANEERDTRGRKSKVRPDVFMRSVAVKAKISTGYVSKILRGISTPSIPVAQRMAKAMGLTLEDFLQQIPTTGKAKARGKQGGRKKGSGNRYKVERQALAKVDREIQSLREINAGTRNRKRVESTNADSVIGVGKH